METGHEGGEHVGGEHVGGGHEGGGHDGWGHDGETVLNYFIFMLSSF